MTSTQLLNDVNIKAVLQTIRESEGTTGVNGYEMLFGGKLFTDFSNHPFYTIGFMVKYTNKAGVVINTSAAGAYQITHSTWDSLKKMLGLNNFGPLAQDLCAIELIKEKVLLVDIMQGNNIPLIFNKLSSIWASLPASDANQPKHNMQQILDWYSQAGGKIKTIV